MIIKRLWVLNYRLTNHGLFLMIHLVLQSFFIHTPLTFWLHNIERKLDLHSPPPLNFFYIRDFRVSHSGPEKLKKSRPKKLVKANKSISRKKFFWPNSIFCDFKNGQKLFFFVLGNSLKLPKMQFHEKNMWFIWFQEFFCLDFF